MIDPKVNCRNCGAYISPSDAYCAHCGQSVKESRLTIKDLVNNFWNSLFNFDGTIVKTLKLAFKPWKLTLEYVEGKRKTYLHPVRYYLVTVFLVALVSIGSNKNIKENVLKGDAKIKYYHSQNLSKIDSIAKVHPLNSDQREILDFIKEEVYKDIKPLELDTVTDKELSYVVFTSKGQKFRVLRKDALFGDPETLLKKYEIKGFMNEIAFVRQLKLIREGSAFTSFLRNNILWAILLAIVSVSFIMKLLYKKHYLVENLVFLMYFHATYFLAFAVIAPFELISSKIWNICALVLLGIFPFFLGYNLFHYYRNSLAITIAKTLLISILYFFSVLIMAVLIFVVGIFSF